MGWQLPTPTDPCLTIAGSVGGLAHSLFIGSFGPKTTASANSATKMASVMMPGPTGPVRFKFLISGLASSFCPACQIAAGEWVDCFCTTHKCRGEWSLCGWRFSIVPALPSCAPSNPCQRTSTTSGNPTSIDACTLTSGE